VTETVHTRSRGVPRIINVICDAALVFGYAEERRQVDVPLIQEVLAELETTGILPPLSGSPEPPAVVATPQPAIAAPQPAIVVPQPMVATPHAFRAVVPPAVAVRPSIGPELSLRAAQLDQREQALTQREHELAEQRRILAEEYRLLRTRTASAAGDADRYRPAHVHAMAAPTSIWDRVKRAMLGSAPAVD